MMREARWRLYYGDGSTFSSADGPPFDAPPANVQVVVCQDSSTPTGFNLRHGLDAYYWRDDVGWQGCDVPGLWDYLMMHRGPKVVLFGRSVRDDDFWKIVSRSSTEGLG